MKGLHNSVTFCVLSVLRPSQSPSEDASIPDVDTLQAAADLRSYESCALFRLRRQCVCDASV